jgi:hypothetical protein
MTIGEGCTRRFSAPSALLHHLESGKCCSAMDRDVIYDIIQLYDKDCTIHSLPTLTPSSSTHISSHRLSPVPRTPTASLDSSGGWSLITPAPSQGSEVDSLVDSSPLEDSSCLLGKRRVVDEIEPELCCSLCPRKRTAFATMQALQQYMLFLAHCDKVYHCPSDIPQQTPTGSTLSEESESDLQL